MHIRLQFEDGTKQFVGSFDEADAAMVARRMRASLKILSMTLEEMDIETDKIRARLKLKRMSAAS